LRRLTLLIYSETSNQYGISAVNTLQLAFFHSFRGQPIITCLPLYKPLVITRLPVCAEIFSGDSP
jgi:hypothetical protein